MPRKKGAVNYKNNVLIGIVEEILPNGQIAWEAVGAAYQKQSNEKEERDWNDIKKHWMKNLCNNMKKPTGSTGENGDRVCKCISIEKKIMRKTHSGFLGDSSAEGDYMPSPSGSDDVDGIGGGDDVGGEFPGDDDSASDARSALLNSSFETDNIAANDDELEIDEVREDDTQRPQDEVTVAGSRVLENNERATRPPPQCDNAIATALRRASSTIRSEKTKNSSNKNTERTSIAGAIVKLIERQQPSSSNQEREDRSSYMTMTLMRQLDRMNKSMDDRERRERRQRKKRRAKRRAKKMKRCATLEQLSDHGGKAGGGVAAAAVVMIAAARRIVTATIAFIKHK